MRRLVALVVVVVAMLTVPAVTAFAAGGSSRSATNRDFGQAVAYVQVLNHTGDFDKANTHLQKDADRNP
jgi:hypothetical protein